VSRALTAPRSGPHAGPTDEKRRETAAFRFCGVATGREPTAPLSGPADVGRTAYVVEPIPARSNRGYRALMRRASCAEFAGHGLVLTGGLQAANQARADGLYPPAPRVA
jgi:hypothetical protein